MMKLTDECLLLVATSLFIQLTQARCISQISAARSTNYQDHFERSESCSGCQQASNPEQISPPSSHLLEHSSYPHQITYQPPHMEEREMNQEEALSHLEEPKYHNEQPSNYPLEAKSHPGHSLADQKYSYYQEQPLPHPVQQPTYPDGKHYLVKTKSYLGNPLINSRKFLPHLEETQSLSEQDSSYAGRISCCPEQPRCITVNHPANKDQTRSGLEQSPPHRESPQTYPVHPKQLPPYNSHRVPHSINEKPYPYHPGHSISHTENSKIYPVHFSYQEQPKCFRSQLKHSSKLGQVYQSHPEPSLYNSENVRIRPVYPFYPKQPPYYRSHLEHFPIHGENSRSHPEQSSPHSVKGVFDNNREKFSEEESADTGLDVSEESEENVFSIRIETNENKKNDRDDGDFKIVKLFFILLNSLDNALKKTNEK